MYLILIRSTQVIAFASGKLEPGQNKILRTANTYRVFQSRFKVGLGVRARINLYETSRPQNGVTVRSHGLTFVRLGLVNFITFIKLTNPSFFRFSEPENAGPCKSTETV
ncbi:hypothetical protein NQ315_015119 [Exocentrus adspersus]|uniref:Uncharacterized protein n=1 Tax=Exocentrus adspersus TaxID=1586481 RepID=A0AAV8V9H1_9CUCU|nr:hypothetical protein NQ315_015119 [Exocentrus adspersus]